MGDRRFRHLERDRVDPVDQAEAVDQVEAVDPVEEVDSADLRRDELETSRRTTQRRRALERDGELGVDRSTAPRTHFCRACEAETREGATECFNCGAAIGRAGQDVFDAVKRREIAALREEHGRARRRSRAVERARKAAERQREAEAEPRRGRTPRSSGSDSEQLLRNPGFALGVLITCVFATVSATLHMLLSAAYSDSVPWSVLSEVAIAVIITWMVFTGIRKKTGL